MSNEVFTLHYCELYITSLTERNSSSGKTKCRSKKCAILVVRSYSAILETEM